MPTELIVYGADWCGDTRRTCTYLDDEEIAYTYVELEDDPEAAAWVRAQNDDRERKPTLRLIRPQKKDVVIAVPTNAELEAWLKKHPPIPKV